MPYPATYNLLSDGRQAWFIQADADADPGWHWDNDLPKRVYRRGKLAVGWGDSSWIKSTVSRARIRDEMHNGDVAVCYQTGGGGSSRQSVLGFASVSRGGYKSDDDNLPATFDFDVCMRVPPVSWEVIKNDPILCGSEKVAVKVGTVLRLSEPELRRIIELVEGTSEEKGRLLSMLALPLGGSRHVGGGRAASRKGSVRTFDPHHVIKTAQAGEIADPVKRAAALEKATKGHNNLLVALQSRLVELGAEPERIEEDPMAFDMRAKMPDVRSTWIFEAKTTSDQNVHDQVRMGLAQLLDYRLTSGPSEARLCLLVDRPLVARQQRLLESVEVGCIARVGGSWSVEALKDDSFLKRLANVESAPTRKLRHKVDTPKTSEAMSKKNGARSEVAIKAIREADDNHSAGAPMLIDASSPVIVLKTTLDRAQVEWFAFAGLSALVAATEVSAANLVEMFVFCGDEKPGTSGRQTLLAFTESAPRAFVDRVQAAISNAANRHVERTRGRLSDLRLPPLARVGADGLQRLVLMSERDAYGADLVVLPSLGPDDPPLSLPVVPCIVQRRRARS